MPAVFAKRIAGAVLFFLLLVAGLARAQTGPGTLSFSPAIITVSEGAGNAILTVTRTLGSDGAISVSFMTIDGSALAPGDYAATTGTISWANGETASKPISIPVIQNTTLEGTRYFNVILTNATGGATIATQSGGPIKAIVRISDDEPDTFPVGGVFPTGFTSEINSAFQNRWTVEPNQGHLSPTSLQSGSVFGYFAAYYDEDTGNYVVSDVLSPGMSRLRAEGDFLAGNLTFSYKLSAGPQAKLNLYTYSSSVDLGTGQTGWQTVVVPVSKGFGTFDWYFSNIATTPCAQSLPPTADGQPCADLAYLDTIVLPPKANRLTVYNNGVGTTQVSGEADCLAQYCTYFQVPGSTVTLTATAAGNYFFTGWSGGSCTGTGTCTLTMDAARSVNAIFLPLAPRLTTGIADYYNAGTGTITSSPAGINCPADCTEAFANGTMVTLTATPDAGSTFTGWLGGGCSGTGTCTVNMSDFTTVQAIFINQIPPVTVQISGTGMGTITSTPPGISCPGTCSFGFPLNSMVTLTATPAPGSYGGFLNLCAGAPASCTFSIGSPTLLSVQFQTGTVPDPPTLVSALISGSTITVTFSPPANDGGVPISGYHASCGALAIDGTSSPQTLTGATPGTPYSCTVTARNAAGTSAPSNAVIASPQLALLGVVSRKSHGSAGFFEIDIDRAAALNGPVTVEPRFMGAGHLLVFDFNLDITSVAAATASTGTTSLAWAGKKVFVTLNEVPDNRRVLVSLLGVASAGGTHDENIAIGFLVGDVSQSRSVTAADVSATKARSGQMVNPDNFRFDIDLSGVIDRSDVSAAKSRAGTKLP